MPIIEITCDDCGATRRTSYKNTKVCRECRLLRNIKWIKQPQVCAVRKCSTEFLPIARGEIHCAEHTPIESQIEVECAFCQKEEFSVLEDVKVCSYCARDPIHRRQFMKALIKRQRDRAELHRGATVIQ